MNACDDCLAKSLLRALAMGVLVDTVVDRDSARRAVGRKQYGSSIDSELERLRERLFEHAGARPVWPLCEHDELFPSGIRELGDSPRVIFGCGTREALEKLPEQPAVALVGARRATPAGREITYRLGREMAAAGVTVVSGMAFGIDAAAHRGALQAGGLTVAVLAGSPGMPYPGAHAALHRQIAETGLVLSEFPPGSRVAKWGFPARNRLIAALSRVTVAVEGRHNSGALHTTEFATQLGRVVAAVPASVTSPLSELPNGLLYDGAQLIRDGRDLLELFFGPQHAQAQIPGIAESVPEELRPAYDAVRSGATSPAAVGEALDGLNAIEAAGLLGRLELLGAVHRDASGEYVAKL